MSSLLTDLYQLTMFDAYQQEGMEFDTSADAPALDAVYKLQSYAGRPRRKRSEGKATWPGVKQVWRSFDANGVMERDTVQLESEPGIGQALLQPCMVAGRRTGPAPTLEAVRSHHAAAMATLPAALRALAPATAPYPVQISAALRALAAELDAAPC